MKCSFKHHPLFNRGDDLGKCLWHPESELVCGPMTCSACTECNPHLLKVCRLCKQKHWQCSC